MRRPTSNTFALGIAAVLLAAVVVLTGCGSGDAADRPGAPADRTPVATPTEPAPTAVPGKTGVSAVDEVIEAVLAGDVKALRDLFVFSPVACEESPQGAGAPPTCAPGEPDGTPVDVIAVAQCEGYYVRPAEAGTIELPVMASTLYAVYAAPDTLWPEGEYAVIFERGESHVPQAWELVMTDEGITGIHHGCAMSAERIAESQRLTDIIVAPE